MKNNKGFTLIELLAVIVILGLLLAIAIPSITKYIIESRKKTVVSSIDGYMSSVIASVNEQEYNFTTPNTIYAVPIECISLENGGKNPLGEWLQANDDYWAYVLVQYDSETLSYDYGFAFKDSNGYGLYPTIQSKLNEKGMQIQTNLEIKRPKNGSIEKVTLKSNWNGFNINDDTQLKVLRAALDGGIGDGIKTCTLQQKGSNYNQLNYQESDKNKAEKELPVLIKTSTNDTNAFWKYREQIKTITFEDIIDIPSEISEEHKWDVSSTGNGMVMAYVTPNVFDSSYYDLYIQGDERLYANSNSSNLFYGFTNVDNINNISLLNTSKVTTMYGMFQSTGYKSTEFILDLGDNFDTSKVNNMGNMFYNTGYNSTVFTLDLGDNFDTSNVTSMGRMFQNTGYKSTLFTLDLGDKFDTSSLSGVSNMFNNTGYSSKVFKLDLGDKFYTSKVTYTGAMFLNTGYSSLVFTLDLGDNFDMSSVTNMEDMFNRTGYSSEVFVLDLGDKFDTSNVTSTRQMFMNTGYKSPVFTLDLGDKFDTSNVTNMFQMFWNTGAKSSIFKVDCSSWNVNKVTNYGNFNGGVKTKVIAPTWVN